MEFVAGVEEELWGRFAAAAAGIRCFGGDVDLFETNSMTGKVLGEALVDTFDVLKGEVAAAHAGLVGNDEELETGGLEAGQRRGGPGKEGDLIGGFEVFPLFDDGAVAIQENSSVHGRKMGEVNRREQRKRRGLTNFRFLIFLIFDFGQLRTLLEYARNGSEGITMIEVKHSAGDEWLVCVHGAVTTHHRVRVTKADLERFSASRSTEELLQQSFQFLLERESNTSILPSFDLPVIGRYFPEYERHIRARLQPGK